MNKTIVPIIRPIMFKFFAILEFFLASFHRPFLICFLDRTENIIAGIPMIKQKNKLKIDKNR